MEESTSIWNTTMSDLTVGQYVKMSVVSVAVTVTALGALAAVGTVTGKVKEWKFRRDLNKTEEDLEELLDH